MLHLTGVHLVQKNLREMTKINIKKTSGDLGYLLFIVTEDWYFCSHRLQLAVAAQKAGYNVAVVTQETNHGDEIRQAGLRLIPIKFQRSGRNPFSDFMTIRSLLRIYKSEQPDIIHHVSLKPILYGSIAARFVGIPNVINAMTGLGYIFTSKRFFARLIRLIITPVLKLILGFKNTYSIYQNIDDQKLLAGVGGLTNKKSIVIRGSGVESNLYLPDENKTYPPIVILASRMLIDKGIHEFVKAARIIKEKHIDAQFILVGMTDTENHSAISEIELQQWQQEGIIEWWGHRDNVVEVLRKSTIACLPSYREGMPKFLLEAASVGLPIVTTDVPGCREVVIDNENGYLVPPRNSEAIASAIEKLLNDKTLRKEMGIKGRALVKQEFDTKKIVEQTISLYQRMLN